MRAQRLVCRLLHGQRLPRCARLARHLYHHISPARRHGSVRFRCAAAAQVNPRTRRRQRDGERRHDKRHVAQHGAPRPQQLHEGRQARRVGIIAIARRGPGGVLMLPPRRIVHERLPPQRQWAVLAEHQPRQPPRVIHHLHAHHVQLVAVDHKAVRRQASRQCRRPGFQLKVLDQEAVRQPDGGVVPPRIEAFH